MFMLSLMIDLIIVSFSLIYAEELFPLENKTVYKNTNKIYF